MKKHKLISKNLTTGTQLMYPSSSDKKMRTVNKKELKLTSLDSVF